MIGFVPASTSSTPFPVLESTLSTPLIPLTSSTVQDLTLSTLLTLFKLDSEYRYSLGFQSEYLPTSCPVTYIQERNNGILILEGDAFIDILKDDVPNLVFQVNKIDEEVVLELPRIYYLGYVLKDEQGNSIFLEESEYGFLKATLSKEGKYTLSYEGTNYRNYSKVCAFIGIMLFILNLCYCKRESVNKG